MNQRLEMYSAPLRALESPVKLLLAQAIRGRDGLDLLLSPPGEDNRGALRHEHFYASSSLMPELAPVMVGESKA